MDVCAALIGAAGESRVGRGRAEPWCREHGIFSHDLTQWRSDFCQVPGGREGQEELRQLRQVNVQLQRDLTRKDKALARREQVAYGQVVLHLDNGSPMKGATLLATLQTLGVMPSLSRPAVSNDNPYSESLFKTLKYRPAYPLHPFADLAAARTWATPLVQWYNHEHRHSAICFVTPGQRHAGLDLAIQTQRSAVYEDARAKLLTAPHDTQEGR